MSVWKKQLAWQGQAIATHTFQYSVTGLQGSTIRLLRLKPYEGPRIRCELFQSSLASDDQTPYEALSYSWGSSEKVDEIELNHGCFRITEQLYSALQHLQLPDKDRVLWIDAICINQSDPKEQGHQVKQMGRIYRQATRVIFWLGKATLEMTVLMQSLQKFQLECDKHPYEDWKVDDERWANLWYKLGPASVKEQIILKQVQQEGLSSVLQRPWFQRVWIVQEVASARTAIVACGPDSVAAHVFALAPSLLGISASADCQAVLDVMPGISRKTSWWSSRPNFHTLMLKFQFCKATDERDKIFALFGLSANPNDHAAFEPDYTKPIESVLDSVLSHLIQVHPGSMLDILGYITNFTSVTAVCLIDYAFHPRRPLQTLSIASVFDLYKSMQTSIPDLLELPTARKTASFLLEKPSITDSHVAQQSCYEEVIKLILGLPGNHDNDIGSSRTMLDKTKKRLKNERPPPVAGRNAQESVTHDTGLRAASWGDFRQNVKILIVEDISKAVLYAARRNYARVTALLLQKGAVPDRALQEASFNGHERIVRLLLKHGADPNAQHGRYDSALHAASSGRHRHIEEILLLSGAKHALQEAAYSGYTSVVQELLELCQDALVDVRDDQGRNPVLAALEGQHEEMVLLLLSHGAMKHSPSTLAVASSIGFERVVHVLLQQSPDPQFAGRDYGLGILYNFSSHDGKFTSGYELEPPVKLSDRRARDWDHGEAWFWAKKAYKEHMAQIILESSTNLDLGGALQLAASTGQQLLVQAIFDQSSAANLDKRYYGIALQIALQGGRNNIAEILLRQGADFCPHALYLAAHRGYEHVVVTLLARGKNHPTNSEAYREAVEAAASNGHAKTVQVLLSNDGDLNSFSDHYLKAIVSAESKGFTSIVEQLQAKGVVTPMQIDMYGSRLQAFCAKGYFKHLRELLNHGADPNKQCGYLGTPLQAASFFGHESCVALLLKSGAHVNTNCGCAGTALRAASSNGHKHVVELLLAHGADVEQDTEYGTAFQAATKNGHTVIAQTLSEVIARNHPKSAQSLKRKRSASSSPDDLGNVV